LAEITIRTTTRVPGRLAGAVAGSSVTAPARENTAMPLNDETTQAHRPPRGADVKALDQALRATAAKAPAAAPAVERRHAPRQVYQVPGTLEPVAFGTVDDVRVVTRDADARGTGFVSTGQLPEGTRAVLHLPAADGRTQRIECRVRRSVEIGNGLFEGSVEFLGDQPQFSETRIKLTPYRR
jgi:hypothetical protein